MTYTAFTIADEILRIAKRNDKELTSMQLMKLVYIAHGWALAILDRDLFEDRIEAWKYGPVIPNLYRATKQFGRNPIPKDMIDEGEGGIEDRDVKSFLEDVYEKYAHLGGIALSNLTHQAGTPWDQKFENGVFNIEIPDDIIKRHYKEKLNEYKKSTAA